MSIIIKISVYIFEFIIFIKILSLRTNWDAYFLKCLQVLSWKQTLEQRWYFAISVTYYSIFGVNTIISDILQIFSSRYDVQLLFTPQYGYFISAYIMFMLLFFFEMFFLFIILFEGTISLLFKRIKRANSSLEKSTKSQLKSTNLISFDYTDSKLFLFEFLIISIVFAMIVSDQVNYYFLDPSLFNYKLFLISYSIVLLLFSYITISINKIVFNRLNVKYCMDFKNNKQDILCLFIGNFIFVNAIYFAKYLKIALVYYPIDTNNFNIINMMSELMMQAGGIPYQDPINLKLLALIDYFIISIISAIVSYLLYIYLNSTPCFLELKQAVLNRFKKRYSSKVSENPQSKIIKKSFLKQLRHQFRNPKKVKSFNYFFYICAFGVPSVVSVIDLYLLINDSTFGTNFYSDHVFRYQYVFAAYTAFVLFLGYIFTEIRKIYNSSLSSALDKSMLNEYLKFFSITFSIAISCRITIFLSWVYSLSEKYDGIVAPEKIQTFQLLFLFLGTEYVLSDIWPKVEDMLNKVIEREKT
ncbi:MAG: hypothetical protein WBJ24_05205 [Methanosarcina flavescens]|uniref:Uncharacterized protein n=1 Tax=Methanosarcina flavescens TaxID=1715806 RepID=A0A7K4AYX8_9EURY|nr:hypothetical protein [Methanosarcina flavescens]